ncbi:hypothetical protein ACFL47_03545 [Candidatus Latescibacterota bacterium]
MKQITRNAGKNQFPSFSPDGSQIVFVSNRFSRITYDILIVDADGSNLKRVTKNMKGWNGRPSWSLDGSKILFDSAGGGNFEIMTIEPDGSNLTNLTNNEAKDFHPCWSPDNSKVAFVSLRDGNEDIFVMNADGSNQVNITNHEYSDMHPKWSPDGTRIAFVSDRDHQFEENVEKPDREVMGITPEYLEKAMKSKRKHDIFVMNADGSNPVNITNYPNNDLRPTWSPDGARIAFVSIRNGKRELFSVKPDGSDIRQITSNDAMEEYPSWGPMPSN